MEAVTWRVDTIIFASMALFGVVLLVVSFIFGEVLDFFQHDLDISVAGHDVVDIGHGGDVPNAAPLVNVQSILAFVTGFGAVAWVLSGYLGFHPLLATLSGLGGGFVAAVPMVLLMRVLYKQSGSAGFNMNEVVNNNATVVLAIPPNGTGRVQYEKRGSRVMSTARSVDGTEIGQGSVVTIQRVVGSEVYVRKAEHS